MSNNNEKDYPELFNYLPLSSFVNSYIPEEQMHMLMDLWKRSEVHGDKIIIRSGIKPEVVKSLIDNGLLKGNYLISSLIPEQILELTNDGKEALRQMILLTPYELDQTNSNKNIKKAYRNRNLFNLKKFKAQKEEKRSK